MQIAYDGYWHAVQDAVTEFNRICDIPTKPSDGSVPCPLATYAATNGECYAVVLTPKTWSDAKKTYVAQGGDLASANGEAENNEVSFPLQK